MYDKMAKYDTIIPTLTNILEEYPNFSLIKYYGKLAYMHAYKGDNAKAEEYMDKIVSIDPSQKENAIKFLEELNQGKLKK